MAGAGVPPRLPFPESDVNSWSTATIAGAFVSCVLAVGALAQETAPPAGKGKAAEGATEENGKWVLPDGTPTYHVAEDGMVDWYTFSGFRRYGASCLQCHGPDGEGSSYAPALVESLKTMSYQEFLRTVASGRVNVSSGKQNVMPALGTNKNVMCFIEDIYAYLKGRSDGAVPRGRPEKRAEKPEAAQKYEKACFG